MSFTGEMMPLRFLWCKVQGVCCLLDCQQPLFVALVLLLLPLDFTARLAAQKQVTAADVTAVLYVHRRWCSCCYRRF